MPLSGRMSWVQGKVSVLLAIPQPPSIPDPGDSQCSGELSQAGTHLFLRSKHLLKRKKTQEDGKGAIQSLWRSPYQALTNPTLTLLSTSCSCADIMLPGLCVQSGLGANNSGSTCLTFVWRHLSPPPCALQHTSTVSWSDHVGRVFFSFLHLPSIYLVLKTPHIQ